MQSFDDFYGSVFNKRWPSIRAALLTEHKYVALVNHFGDVEKTMLQLECDGAINLRRLYETMQDTYLNPQIEESTKSVNSGKDSKTTTDKSLEKFVRKQASTDIVAAYEDKMSAKADDAETSSDNKVLEPLEMAKFNKSLGEMSNETELDWSRMLMPEASTAGLQEFVPASRLKGMEDYVPESHHYKYYSTTVDFPLHVELEVDFTFPEHLNAYVFERGNVTRFRRPTKAETGALTHFLMDGASLLPPLMLDVQPGDTVLDACASPGGKSLVMMQSLHPKLLVANDLTDGRVKRIPNLMKQYFPDFDEHWRDSKCVIRRADAIFFDEYERYDRVRAIQKCLPNIRIANAALYRFWSMFPAPQIAIR